MKRLKRADNDNIENVQMLLDRISNISGDLREIYYVLFDNLSELFQSYPELYKHINMTVKLPTNYDAEAISKFNSDLLEMLQKLKDRDYLSEYIGIKDE